MDYLSEMALFVEVAEAKGFSKAAAKLGMPQSTLSRRVGELEKQLGLQLLKRTTRRVDLTEAGLRYFERVKPIVEEVRRIHDELGGMLVRLACCAYHCLLIFRMNFSHRYSLSLPRNIPKSDWKWM